MNAQSRINSADATAKKIMKPLSLELLKNEATSFSKMLGKHHSQELFGVTDDKTIGTFLEHAFQTHLSNNYDIQKGSSAKGIDLPELNVDIKTTSIRQPQSSCPFKSAREKIYGLNYHLLVFVYDKSDNTKKRTGNLKILHTIFIQKNRTADYQTTIGLKKILENNATLDDVIAFFQERMLPVDDIQARDLAEEVITTPPTIGYLTLSNALQWRLQYSRVITEAGQIDGVDSL